MHGGYGKIILLGEHFVVHGQPALVTALDLKTKAQIEQTSTALQIIDNRPKIPTYQPLKMQEYERMVRSVFTALGINPSGWRVTFSGTLPVTNGGIGASAAAAVALAHAINDFFNLNLSHDQINHAAFAGEKEIHGNPSGIDNTAATFGGMFTFQKGLPSQPQRIHKEQTDGDSKELYFIIADSGRPTNTKLVLAAVNNFKLQATTNVTILFECYAKLFNHALYALKKGDLASLGNAMSKNHTLLQDLGVSSPELDYLVALAHKEGALGAKLTGTGCGGLMIALAHDKQTQENISQAFLTAGFFTMKQNIKILPNNLNS